MVLVIDGADLRVGAGFREFFLFFFLLLFFLLAGIGALETSDLNLVDPHHGSHQALGASGLREEGSDLSSSIFPLAEEIIPA